LNSVGISEDGQLAESRGVDELFQSVQSQILLTVIGVLLLAVFVRWCRDVLRTVRQVRSGEYARNELPGEFSRWPALMMLACSMAFLAVLFFVGIKQGDDAAIAFFFIPSLLVMGLAGLFDPRLIWSVHPDAKEKLPAAIRIVGITLAVLSFLVGLGWYLSFSLS
jgi:hypothetical protein